MGRIADLFGEVAAAADEGPEGLLLPPEDYDRLRAEWSEDDLEDALALVRESFLQSELIDAADSLSTRLVEVLGELGEASAFARAEADPGPFNLEIVAQLARRVGRLEEILEVFREDAPPDRTGFDRLCRHLADHGIEAEMGGRPEGEGDQDGDPDDEE